MDKSSVQSKIPSGIPQPRSRSRSKSREHPSSRGINSPDDGSRSPYDGVVSPNPEPETRYGVESSNYKRTTPTSYISSNDKGRPPLISQTALTKELQQTKSNFPNMFKTSRPDEAQFEKQLGYKGLDATVDGDGPRLPEDISGLFQRPDFTPKSLTNANWSNSPNDPSKYLKPDDKKANAPLSAQLDHNNNRMPNVFPSRNTDSYKSPKDLDNMLAKYKSKPLPQMGNEYQVYPAIISNNYSEKSDQTHHNSAPLKDYYTPSYKQAIFSDTKEVNGRNGNGHGTYDAAGKMQDTLRNIAQVSTQKQRIDEDSSDEDLVNSVMKRYNKSSKHSFPFTETPNGMLAIYPDQVAFESKKISVLVSDPKKAGILKTEKALGIREQDFMMQQVEDVIQKSLSQIAGKLKLSKDSDGKNDFWNKNMDEQYPKDVLPVNYSAATLGSEKLMHDLHQRMRFATNADTHIVIGNTIFPCHSIALEVFSKYFDRLARPTVSIRKLELPDTEVCPTAFPLIMDWIMQNEEGRGSVMTKTNVVSIYSAAQFLEIPELKIQCVAFLQEKVETNDRHLMELWGEIKKRVNCQDLMAVITSKAASSFQHIYKTRQFVELEVSEIVMLLSSDDIVVESELDTFDTAVRWLLNEWEDRKIYTNQVMGTVRFGLLTPLQLTQIWHSKEVSKDVDQQKYSDVLNYGMVKSMLDEGLAYSIVRESYKNNHVEIQKWVDSTGIKVPRRRKLSPSARNLGPIYDTDDLNRPGFQSEVERCPSFTVHGLEDKESEKGLGYNSSLKIEAGRKQSVCELSDKNASGKAPSRRSRSQSYQNSDLLENRYQRDMRQSTSKHFQHAAQALGQPFKDEDIESVSAHFTDGRKQENNDRR